MSEMVSTLLLLASQPAAGVGAGRIQGGWEFVWTAYGITWAGLCLYVLSLWLRRRSAESRRDPR